MNVKQNIETPDIEVQLDFRVMENNTISKIRIILSQNSGWRALTYYSMKNQEEFSIFITDFENINSNVKLFLEVSDIYGNIATSNVTLINIFANEVIPYLLIGIILGFSIGLASVSSVFYKKREEKKLNSKNGLIKKGAGLILAPLIYLMSKLLCVAN